MMNWVCGALLLLALFLGYVADDQSREISRLQDELVKERGFNSIDFNAPKPFDWKQHEAQMRSLKEEEAKWREITDE